MSHRGPDSGGVHVDGMIGLGHRRLAVIALGEEGHQPMADGANRLLITYNGELYNYRELRESLRERGVSFFTETDTEVILEAFKLWGEDCLERFVGMFAFAIWDSLDQSLFLARDRLGKKPLFYMELPTGGILFASELKALVQDPCVSRRIDPYALKQYLFASYVSTGRCMLSDVKKLAPAHWLRVHADGKTEMKQYWDLSQFFLNKRAFRSVSHAGEVFKDLLNTAVRLRLESDVPLGSFLSGGIDSSAIVGSMTSLMRSDLINTYSVGFHEEGYSELPMARMVANHLGVVHSDNIITSNIADDLSDIVWHADEPLADTSMIPTYYLSRFAREHVTVCLSGDGGDELFAGYPTYLADVLCSMTRGIPQFMRNMCLAGVDRWWKPNRDKVSLQYKVRHFLANSSSDVLRSHVSWRSIFSSDEMQCCLSPDVYENTVHYDPANDYLKFVKDVNKCHYLDQALYVDTKTWLVDDILTKVDRASMAHSLEVRCPLLDHRVVEFAASLDVKLKMTVFNQKRVLKNSQRGILPRKTIRQRKRGFNSPISHWIASAFMPVLREGMSDERMRAIFNMDYFERLVGRHLANETDAGLKILNFVNFYLWCKAFDARLA